MFDQPDAGIDRWRPGGDCCGWFYMRLLQQQEIDHRREPVMEDWGWTFAVTANEIPVAVNTWAYHEIPNCWLMGLQVRERRLLRYPEARRALAHNRVADGIDSIIRHDARFTRHHWLADNPFNTGVKSIPEGMSAL